MGGFGSCRVSEARGSWDLAYVDVWRGDLTVTVCVRMGCVYKRSCAATHRARVTTSLPFSQDLLGYTSYCIKYCVWKLFPAFAFVALSEVLTFDRCIDRLQNFGSMTRSNMICLEET